MLLASHPTPIPVRPHPAKGGQPSQPIPGPSSPWKCVLSCLGREFRSWKHRDRGFRWACVLSPSDFSLYEEGCNCHRIREDPPKWNSRAGSQTPDLQVVRLVFKCMFAWLKCLCSFCYCVLPRKKYTQGPQYQLENWFLKLTVFLS